jgi:hypothetical protein
MFLGHYAAALAAKRAAPEAGLGMLTAAAVGLDLVWPVLVLAGAESVSVAPGITAVTPLDFESYPYSQSLLAAALWSAAAAAAYRLAKRSPRAAAAVGLCVLSHWLLDLVAHRPDLPLTLAPDAAKYGLGLWFSRPATFAVECALLAGGALLARRAGVPGRGLAFFCGVLFLVFLGALFGPPPPDGRAVAASGLLQWLFVGWAAWLDRA